MAIQLADIATRQELRSLMILVGIIVGVWVFTLLVQHHDKEVIESHAASCLNDPSIDGNRALQWQCLTHAD